MVTHSRFNSFPVMSSSPVECGRRLPPAPPHRHRYKTFSSPLQYQLVLSAVRKLKESGFYWSTMGGKEASAVLSAEPVGTFLVRDSSDHRHFFTLSVKTATGTKNLRIQCDSCSFFLQTDPRDAQKVPHFDCVLKLIHHYMHSASSTDPCAEGSMAIADATSAAATTSSTSGSSGSSGHCGKGAAGRVSAGSRGSVYFIYSEGEKIPLELLRPLTCSMSTLQHLCRKTVNGHLDMSAKREQLPQTLQEFLEEYDAPI